MPKLGLDRQQLARFLPNQEAIVAFERVFEFTARTPDTIEEAAALAGTAAAIAHQALALLAEFSAALEQLSTAPARATPADLDDCTPAAATPAAPDDFAPALALHQHEPLDVGADATDLDTVITLANNLRAALVANGIAN